MSMKFHFVILTSLLCQLNTFGANKDFNLELFAPLLPGQNWESTSKQLKKVETLQEQGSSKIIKAIFFDDQKNMFQAFVQINQNIISDSFIRPPTHMDHNEFLKALQKKYGKQNFFKNKDRSSMYVWDKIPDLKIVYQGSCSLSCFAMFISFASLQNKSNPSLFEQLDEFTKPQSRELKK